MCYIDIIHASTLCVRAPPLTEVLHYNASNVVMGRNTQLNNISITIVQSCTGCVYCHLYCYKCAACRSNNANGNKRVIFFPV